MKISECRQLTPAKLLKALADTRRELAVARFHLRTGQDTNSAKIKYLRRLIAKIITVFHNEKKS